MANKKKHALEQGSVAEIFKRFIAPLTKYKSELMDLKSFWDMIFHVGTRDIERFVVKTAFRMPGLCFVAPTVKIQGVGVRAVKAGDILWVRTDASSPNQIDVQWLGPGRDQVFSLNESEWNSVRPKLTHKDELYDSRLHVSASEDA